MSKETFESKPGAMVAGKSYLGHGMTNEYGEFHFRPCQTGGPNPNGLKQVTATKGVKLQESVNLWKLEITLKKSEAVAEQMEARIETARELINEYAL